MVKIEESFKQRTVFDWPIVCTMNCADLSSITMTNVLDEKQRKTTFNFPGIILGFAALPPYLQRDEEVGEKGTLVRSFNTFGVVTQDSEKREISFYELHYEKPFMQPFEKSQESDGGWKIAKQELMEFEQLSQLQDLPKQIAVCRKVRSGSSRAERYAVLLADSKLMSVGMDGTNIVFENNADQELAPQLPLFVFEQESVYAHSCVLVMTDVKQQKDSLYVFFLERSSLNHLMTFESRIAKIWQTKEGLKVLDTNSNLSLVKLTPDT